MRAALLGVVAAGLAAAPAEAALNFAFEGCEGNFECARVTVPLDRSGAIPGTLKLYVEHAGGEPGAGVVFALAGGPGQGATTISEDFNRDLHPAIGKRDMIVFDQRGTGRSGALSCDALDRPDDRPIDVRTAECAEQLGARRSLYTTRDSVEDLEAVRAALGVEKISIVGVSYGTKVAVGYAMAHPDRVERLVLDSVVDPLAQDPFALAGLAALPRILDEVKLGLAQDVADLVDSMAGEPLRGLFVDSRGRRRTKTVTPRDLYGSIRAADLDPARRAEYPAAVRSAVLGDPAPLIRMEHRYSDFAFDESEPPPDATEQLSFTLQAATLCEEEALPWERTASPDERDRQATEAAAAVPDTAFEPFDRTTMLVPDSNNLLFQCRRWPGAAQTPALTGSEPDVPVLVLEGREDTRTPLEVGAGVAARFPQGVVVEVPKTAHAVLGQRGCARIATRRFFAGQAPGDPCRAVRGRAPLIPLAPPSTAAAGSPLRAVLRTLDDLAREQSARLFGTVRGGGLRGGRFAQRRGRLEVKAFSYVPGLAISGRLRPRSLAGVITVSGDVTGTLRLKSGRLRGTLDGKPVAARWRRP